MGRMHKRLPIMFLGLSLVRGLVGPVLRRSEAFVPRSKSRIQITSSAITSRKKGTRYHPLCSQLSTSTAASLEYYTPNSNETMATSAPTLPEAWLEEDHYNGITIHLDRAVDADDGILTNPLVFAEQLHASLEEWRQQGRRGIWLHINHEHADKVPVAVAAGFRFHMIAENQLVMNQWLPVDTINRLPGGLTHQVGVGCLVLNPVDPSQMLVVQEKTGPAATFQLWKMPTGLTDPGEDIHVAAVRELKEETGLDAVFTGILEVRQAHPVTSSTNKDGTKQLRRSCSDLFFVCLLELQYTKNDNNSTHTEESMVSLILQACPEEIAAIQWMSVADYCNQARWQTSPVYLEMNRIILQASQAGGKVPLLQQQTLELGFGRGTNTLYHAMINNNDDNSNADVPLESHL